MKVDLFLDDINRDVFDTLEKTENWRSIYQDAIYFQVMPQPDDPPFLTDPDGNSWRWTSLVYVREELPQIGGLLFDATNNRVFKLDREAFEALSVIWVQRRAAHDFSDDLLNTLFSYLKQHGLIKPVDDKKAD